MTFQHKDASWDPVDDASHLRKGAEKLYADRVRRVNFLPSALFGEAAWDTMLIIFAGEPHSTHCADSLASELGLPLSTMMRWIGVLEAEGLILARRVPIRQGDGPIKLSNAGRDAVAAYLRATM